jgi:hypothetical protein
MIDGITLGVQMFLMWSLFSLGIFLFNLDHFTMYLSVFSTKGFWYGAKLIREEDFSIGNVYVVSMNE